VVWHTDAVTESKTVTPAYWQPEHLDAVILEGADVVSYVQSQISQEIRSLPVGASTWTFVLAPTGKVEVFGRVVRTGDQSMRIEVDAGFGQTALERLNRFKIRVDVTASLELASQPQISTDDEIQRIRAGWPRMGSEIISGDTIPAETGLIAIAVNFTKGCYPGQELVERMDARGAQAPQSLRLLQIEDGAASGDPILGEDGSPVGKLTSVTPGWALGYVKRSSTVGEVVSIQPL
jgi:folate-binding protein YgfZ